MKRLMLIVLLLGTLAAGCITSSEAADELFDGSTQDLVINPNAHFTIADSEVEALEIPYESLLHNILIRFSKGHTSLHSDRIIVVDGEEIPIYYTCHVANFLSPNEAQISFLALIYNTRLYFSETIYEDESDRPKGSAFSTHDAVEGLGYSAYYLTARTGYRNIMLPEGQEEIAGHSLAAACFLKKNLVVLVEVWCEGKCPDIRDNILGIAESIDDAIG